MSISNSLSLFYDLFALNQFSDAVKNVTKLIQDMPTAGTEQQDRSVMLYFNRALANYQLDLYRQSLKDLDYILSVQPNNLKAHMRKGERNVLHEISFHIFTRCCPPTSIAFISI
jgi:tetratricopeptide (TPR) repeat protein